MLKKLQYSVQFPTGKTLSSDVDFDAGMTAVSGRNEAGKSMILEMIRFGLFGSAALRGKATDYKKLSMELTFSIKDTDYTVTRTATKAELVNTDGPVASGTRPVNQHIQSLFGYDLSVFDTANNCAQGEIERLGSMKPTERKALIDQTVGLSAIDALTEWLGGELTAARRAYEAMSEILAEPEEPQKPKYYLHSDRLKIMLDDARQLLSEQQSLEGWLNSASSRKAPHHPGKAPSTNTAAELGEYETKRRQENDLRNRLMLELERLPVTDLTAEQVEEYYANSANNSLVRRRQQLEERYPAADIDTKTIEEADKAHDAQKLIEEIRRLESHGQIECPACGSDFAHEHKAIDQIKIELTGLEPFDLPLAERFPRRDLDRQMARHEERLKVQDEIDSLPTELLDEPYSAADLLYAKQALEFADRRKEVAEQISSLHILFDKSRELTEQVAWEAQMARFEREEEDWKQFSRHQRTQQVRLDKLLEMNLKVCVSDIEARLTTARVYEADLARYSKALATYTQNKLIADQHKEKAEDLESARKAMKILKARIKGYLLPSLNKVASVLLNQMTGGERATIKIDDDFEITVDGQPLATLSGSGKAVANLAIRLGLGQVLTNRVFSVFMADEIDAAMDVNRAGFTAECLSRLTSSIGQVILVSHKTINATHHIVLGSTNELAENCDRNSGTD